MQYSTSELTKSSLKGCCHRFFKKNKHDLQKITNIPTLLWGCHATLGPFWGDRYVTSQTTAAEETKTYPARRKASHRLRISNVRDNETRRCGQT